MIPVKRNLRNLTVRWMTTLMTVIGTGLVLWASVLSIGLTDGLEHVLQITGQELDLIVPRKGSTDETSRRGTEKLRSRLPKHSGVFVRVPGAMRFEVRSAWTRYSAHQHQQLTESNKGQPRPF